MLAIRSFERGCQPKPPGITFLQRTGKHGRRVTVALIRDDQASLVGAEGLPVGSGVNDGDEDLDVVEGICPAITEGTTPCGGQVPAQGYQPLALQLGRWHQDQNFDALPYSFKSGGDPNACLAGTGNGFHHAAARIRVPRLQGFLLPGVQKGVVVRGRHRRGRSLDRHLRKRRNRVGSGVG